MLASNPQSVGGPDSLTLRHPEPESKNPYQFALPEKNWLDVIGGEFDQPYMTELRHFLQREENDGHTIFPPREEIFNALNSTAFEKVKVVIIGQDPYHGSGQAHGLCFSVRQGIDIPPSLKNIYKEIKAEYGIEMPPHGDLTNWAAQGVLLLNATLTVRQDTPGSHQLQGWERFTDAIIRAVNEKREPVVFLLWGSFAREKGLMKKDGVALIDVKKHKVLEAPHPSPLSAHRGFLGCGHFKKANDFLTEHSLKPVEWGKI
jgi:uracil-DNA glycosylase